MLVLHYTELTEFPFDLSKMLLRALLNKKQKENAISHLYFFNGGVETSYGEML